MPARQTSPDRPAVRSTVFATILVRDINALSRPALDALAELIAANHRRVQVIATSSVELYELVQCGRFPADLYYRLNVVTLKDELRLAVSGEALLP